MAKRKVVNSSFKRHLLVGLRESDDENLLRVKDDNDIPSDADTVRYALRFTAMHSDRNVLTDPPAIYHASQG